MYAPVVAWIPVQLLLIFSMVLNLATQQVDYTNAFYQASLDQIVFVELPADFEAPNIVLLLHSCPIHQLQPRGSFGGYKKTRHIGVRHKLCPAVSFQPNKKSSQQQIYNPRLYKIRTRLDIYGENFYTQVCILGCNLSYSLLPRFDLSTLFEVKQFCSFICCVQSKSLGIRRGLPLFPAETHFSYSECFHLYSPNFQYKKCSHIPTQYHHLTIFKEAFIVTIFFVPS